MTGRRTLQAELAQLKRDRADEIRYPTGDRDRQLWFERTNRRIVEIRQQLAEMKEEDDDD